eukprot:4969922-Amphidinium_carterae.1
MHPPSLGVVQAAVWYNCRDGDAGEDSQASLRPSPLGLVGRDKEAVILTSFGFVGRLGYAAYSKKGLLNEDNFLLHSREEGGHP